MSTRTFLSAFLLIYLVINSLYAQVVVAPPGPPTRSLSVSLLGIAMGECGSDRDCSHEPVAGFVNVSLYSLQDRVSRQGDNGSNTIWRAPDHTLRCYLLPDAPPSSGPGEGVGSFALRYPSNIQSRTWFFPIQGTQTAPDIDRYTLNFELNLGNPHKDNDFAGTGYHWLAPQERPLRMNHSLRRVLTASEREGDVYYLGPFQTQSDRCHEYWVAFRIRLNTN